jgi:hypothetical protein
MYQFLQVSKCEKCGKVIARQKGFIGIVHVCLQELSISQQISKGLGVKKNG